MIVGGERVSQQKRLQTRCVWIGKWSMKPNIVWEATRARSICFSSDTITVGAIHHPPNLCPLAEFGKSTVLCLTLICRDSLLGRGYKKVPSQMDVAPGIGWMDHRLWHIWVLSPSLERFRHDEGPPLPAPWNWTLPNQMIYCTQHIFVFDFVVKTLDMQWCIWSKPFVVPICCNKISKIEKLKLTLSAFGHLPPLNLQCFCKDA